MNYFYKNIPGSFFFFCILNIFRCKQSSNTHLMMRRLTPQQHLVVHFKLLIFFISNILNQMYQFISRSTFSCFSIISIFSVDRYGRLNMHFVLKLEISFTHMFYMHKFQYCCNSNLFNSYKFVIMNYIFSYSKRYYLF